MSGVLDFNTNPKPLVTQIVERIHRAQLASIELDWNDLPIYETYPRRIPELWAGRPVILFGRYAAATGQRSRYPGQRKANRSLINWI